MDPISNQMEQALDAFVEAGVPTIIEEETETREVFLQTDEDVGNEKEEELVEETPTVGTTVH